MGELTAKERMFVESYCGDSKFNATKAAIKAGYSEKTARSKGSQLLTKVNVQEAVQDFMAKASEKALVTTAEVVSRLWEEANSREEGSSQGGRIAALKILTDFTGGFDANKQKIDHSSSDGSMTPDLNIKIVGKK